jgi:hypothetical protein
MRCARLGLPHAVTRTLTSTFLGGATAARAAAPTPGVALALLGMAGTRRGRA